MNSTARGVRVSQARLMINASLFGPDGPELYQWLDLTDFEIPGDMFLSGIEFSLAGPSIIEIRADAGHNHMKAEALKVTNADVVGAVRITRQSDVGIFDGCLNGVGNHVVVGDH